MIVVGEEVVRVSRLIERVSGPKTRTLICSVATLACLTLPASATDVHYTYDALGRVIGVSFSDGSSASYHYDLAGNRTQTSRTTAPAPTVSNATLSVAYNMSGSVALTASGTYSALSVASNPSHGVATITGTSATYTPTSGYYGSDAFTFIATGPGGASSPATVSVSVGNPPAPTVSNKSLSVGYNSSGTLALAPSGVYTSVATTANPSHGTVSISGANATYTPSSGYYGADVFSYHATGPGGTSSSATVSVTVGNPPAPTVSNKTLTVSYNSPGTVALAPSGVYTSVAAATTPAHGSVSVSGSNATYTPTSGYYGSDSFTFKATGPGGVSAPATVAVTVGSPSAPVVSNKSLSVNYNTGGSVALSPSGVFTSLTITSNPGHGVASISGSNATYTPNSGYYGSDSFGFSATGPGGTSSPATVSVAVGNPPAPGVANKSLNVGYNASGSVALAPSGVYTSLSVVSNPSHGVASISGTSAIYTPTNGFYGSDSFTFKATGPGGASSPATVSVTVANPPAPTVSSKALTVAYNATGSVALSPGGVYSSVSIVSNPSHGSASISGATATYTPTPGYSGTDSFTYHASGPGGTSSTASVSVTVQAPAYTTINVTSAGNLRSFANSAGYSGSASAAYQFVVPSGTTVMGSAGGGTALDTGVWPAGVLLKLVVNGSVYGGGGNGGDGSWNASAGGNGGVAVDVHAPITITVTGVVAGGGGGGSGADDTYDGSEALVGGGGGGGAPNGSPGYSPSIYPAQGGDVSGGGAGGADDQYGFSAGGAGGGLASSGDSAAYNGGDAGSSIRTNGNTVTVNGSGAVY